MKNAVCAAAGAGLLTLVLAAPASANLVTSDITKEAAGTAPVTVDYVPPTTATEGPLMGAATCTPLPGTPFSVGTTTVTCTGMVMGTICTPIDPAHPELGCIPMPGIPMPVAGSFSVTVNAGEGPSFSGLSDRTIDVPSGAQNAVLSYDPPSLSDPSGVDASSLACTPAPGSTIPVGATVVTCTARDTLGNASSASFTATVVQQPAVPGGGGSTNNSTGGTNGSPSPRPLEFKSSRARVAGRFAYVTLSCPATNASRCAGTLTLAARKAKLGSAKFRIAKGKSATVKVRLTRKARKLIARKRRLRATAIASMGSLRSRRSLTLLAARKR